MRSKLLKMAVKAGLGLMAGSSLLLAVACGATHQGRVVGKSGFLGDYSQLTEGKGDEALLRYLNPNADFRKYDKILMEPIKIYPGVKDSYWRDISNGDRRKLLNYFDSTLRSNLGKRFTFVSDPGPGVMRFRIALTELNSSAVALDIVSSVMPPGIALSSLKSIATGRGSAIGQVSVEFEALDGQSGERLAAMVDKRVGNKYTGNLDKLEKWRAAQGAFDYWAERMSVRLMELQGEKPPTKD